GRDIGLYESALGVQPACIARDAHPDYASTRYARQRVKQTGISVLSIQHHHAHMASCMADNRLREPVVGVIFDGAGYGLDGASWGGEFLVGDYRSFRRLAHFRYVGAPGGDQAAREPWRMAAAYLHDAGIEAEHLEGRIPAREL